jgi:hypothetical protein
MTLPALSSRPGPLFLGLAALVLAAAAPALEAQQAKLAPGGAHYTIFQGSKSLGESQYSLAPISGGFTLTSSGHMSLGKFSYSFHNQATIDSSMNLVRDALTGSVNGTKVHGGNIAFNTDTDSTGRELHISVSAAGKQTTNTVDRHRNLVLVPDLDPGAYMLMYHFAANQVPTAWALIPKENGILVPAAYKADADVQGTLNGTSITVHHATAALSDQDSITLELYYNGDELLEADLNAQNFYVVRDGFKLLQHPKPTPPPPGQAPQQTGGQQPGGQQQSGGQQPGSDRQSPPSQQTPQQFAPPQGAQQPQMQPQ